MLRIAVMSVIFMVTYSAMLAAAEATGDQAYYKYVTDRFQFLAEVAPHFRKVLEDVYKRQVAYYCLCADVSIGCVMFRIAIGILAHWFIVVNVVIVY